MNRKLFSPQGEPHGRIVLNYGDDPRSELICFAQSFNSAAKDVIAVLRQDPDFGKDSFDSDFRAFPALFLYRHALELYLKAVIIAGAPLLAPQGIKPINRDTLLSTHSLESLRQDLERVFKAFDWSWDLKVPNLRTIEDFRKFIAELHTIDPGSYAFRYPLDTKGGRALSPGLHFNLFKLCQLFDVLFLAFDNLYTDALERVRDMHQHLDD